MPTRVDPDPYGHDESVPLDSTVVFYDHAFSAGRALEVGVMPSPHRHTQFEVNHVLQGAMTYAFDGHRIAVEAGATAIFFGMVPHQVTACEPGTRFVCLYLPVALLMGLRTGEDLRRALFGGSFVRGGSPLETDAASFRRWRADLRCGDPALMAIVRDELGARLRRLEHDGWVDCRDAPTAHGPTIVRGTPRSDKVDVMTRFIADRSAERVRVTDVARAAGLHPNYAMTLFRGAVGLTITDYLTRNRLDAAQMLLACSDDDVACVAFACGFGSLSRFYDAFKARFGTSPRAFRRSLGRPPTGPPVGAGEDTPVTTGPAA